MRRATRRSTATSAFQEETRNAARALVQAVKLLRRGELAQPDAGLRERSTEVTTT